jgi:hypothetical protein
MMTFRDFRIGWRLLVQEPAYSAVVVLGLSVGFAACFLLLGFVRHSFSYDAQVPDAQQVYLVKTRFNTTGDTKWFELAPLPYLEAARRSTMVVLRKLHGAGHTATANLVGREFARLLALGAAIALPLAALVAALSTLRHTLGALRMTPALILRD